MVLFKRVHLQLVLEGRKTQTRRTHRHMWKVGRAYAIRDRWFTKPQGHILVTHRFKQRLGDISLEDVEKEGYKSIEEYKKAWIEIYGAWNPETVVTIYEFKLQQGSQCTPKLKYERKSV